MDQHQLAKRNVLTRALYCSLRAYLKLLDACTANWCNDNEYDDKITQRNTFKRRRCLSLSKFRKGETFMTLNKQQKG